MHRLLSLLAATAVLSACSKRNLKDSYSLTKNHTFETCQAEQEYEVLQPKDLPSEEEKDMVQIEKNELHELPSFDLTDSTGTLSDMSHEYTTQETLEIADKQDFASGPPKCNGSVRLCNRPYDKVCFAATHNSMSNKEDGWLIPNQLKSLQHQLEDGIRAFLLDLHYNNDEVYLCHTLCELGSLRFVDALKLFKQFLDTHPYEVVTLILESYVSAQDVYNAFSEAGLLGYVYEPQDDKWLTLLEMVESGKRIVVFTDHGGGSYPWYLHAWQFMFENPWQAKSIEDLSCQVYMGQLENPLFLMNHFVEDPFPAVDLAQQANSFDILMEHVSNCYSQLGRLPNFIAVDFYSVGDLFEVVSQVNQMFEEYVN